MSIHVQFEWKLPGIEQPVQDLAPLDATRAVAVTGDGLVWLVDAQGLRRLNIRDPARFVSCVEDRVFVGTGRDVLVGSSVDGLDHWESVSAFFSDAAINHVCGPVAVDVSLKETKGPVWLGVARRDGQIFLARESMSQDHRPAWTVSRSLSWTSFESKGLVADLRMVQPSVDYDHVGDSPMVLATNTKGEVWDARDPTRIVVPGTSAAPDQSARFLTFPQSLNVLHVAGDHRRQRVSLLQVHGQSVTLRDQKSFSQAVIETFARTGPSSLLWYDEEGFRHAKMSPHSLQGLDAATSLLPRKGWPLTHVRVCNGGCWIARANAALEFVSLDLN